MRAVYFPLEYLFWIGFGLGALAIFLFLRDRFVSGPYEYVERGLPLVARVRSIELRVARIVNEIRYFRYYAQIECLHPESGILQYAERASREVTKRDATTYQAGDYATAVYLPGKFATSLQLYGFLELRPGLGLIPAEGVRASTWKDVLGLVGFLTALPFGLLWFLYAFTKFSPLHADPLQMTVTLVTGGILIGGGLVAWVKIRNLRQPTSEIDALLKAEPRPSAISRFFQAIFLFLIAAFCGGLITACVCFWINAGFDRSPAISRPVQIDRMVMVTHKFILREYKIEYHFLDGAQEKAEMMSTPSEMAEFRGQLATAEVHGGLFGWSWVKALHPAADLP